MLAAAIAMACGRSSTGPTPSITSPLELAFGQVQVAQGDTLTWTVTLPAPEAEVAGDQLLLTFTGVGSGTATIAIPANISGYQFALIVPTATADGTLTLTAAIPAVGESVQASVTIKDTKAPVIDSAGITGGPSLPHYNALALTGALLLGAGVTDTLQIWASDNHALTWVGYSIGAPLNIQDSTAVVVASTAQASFPVAIPESLAGSGAPVALFARDADGNRQDDTISAASIISFNQYAVRMAPIQDTIVDLAIDTARGVVYLAQPDSGRIAVLSLATMTYLTPISLTGRPMSFDITRSGDSLVVAVDSATSLAVVRLTGTPQVIGTIAVAPPPEDLGANLVSAVRITNDGYAIVVVRTPHSSGTGTFQTEAVVLARDTTLVPFVNLVNYSVAPPPSTRSGDGTVVFIPGGGGLLYNVTTQVWGEGLGQSYSGNPFGFAVSNSATGDVMVGHQVFFGSGGGAPLGLDTLYSATIAYNGMDAYSAESNCAPSDAACVDTAVGALVRYKLGLWYPYNNLMFPSAGTAVNVAMLPHVARALVVSPDNKTLLALGSNVIMAVDLTSSIPPSASVLARARGALAQSVKRSTRQAVQPRIASSTSSTTAWGLQSMLRVHAVRR